MYDDYYIPTYKTVVYCCGEVLAYCEDLDQFEIDNLLAKYQEAYITTICIN